MNRGPDDVLEIFLQPGEFFFGEGNTRIRTILGSCVAITLWHPGKRIGGMSHYMLPGRPAVEPDRTLDGRYADEVLQLFEREMRRTGTKPRDFQVKMFGGGRMFEHVGKGAKKHLDVSERNVTAGRHLLERHGFAVHAEDMGGSGHRNVAFDLWSGDVWLRKVPLAHRAPVLPAATSHARRPGR